MHLPFVVFGESKKPEVAKSTKYIRSTKMNLFTVLKEYLKKIK